MIICIDPQEHRLSSSRALFPWLYRSLTWLLSFFFLSKQLIQPQYT